MREHIPVLEQEVIDGLSLSAGETVIDATVGLGGHARAILKRIAPGGRLYGFDRDERNLALAREHLSEFADRIELIHDSFSGLAHHGTGAVDAILFDLGFSSVHVDDATRGFSFLREGPLDMRYDQTQELTAQVIINTWSVDDLSRIFRLYGEENRAHDLAKTIVRERREHNIETTTQLADIIARIKPRRGKIHPATKVFQALRIAVNHEYQEIEGGLKAAAEILKPGGRLAVITFHSGEDRLVKRFIVDHDQLQKINKKPIRPSRREQEENPRSRSAKLRIAVKM